MSIAAAAVLYVAAPEICERFGKPGATHLLQLASLALPLLCTSRVCAACVLGFGLTGRSSTITAAQNVTRLLVTVPLVLLLPDVTALGLGLRDRRARRHACSRSGCCARPARTSWRRRAIAGRCAR